MFNPGQRVKCIDISNLSSAAKLVLNKEYTVDAVLDDGNSIRVNGLSSSFKATRFSSSAAATGISTPAPTMSTSKTKTSVKEVLVLVDKSNDSEAIEFATKEDLETYINENDLNDMLDELVVYKARPVSISTSSTLSIGD